MVRRVSNWSNHFRNSTKIIPPYPWLLMPKAVNTSTVTASDSESDPLDSSRSLSSFATRLIGFALVCLRIPLVELVLLCCTSKNWPKFSRLFCASTTTTEPCSLLLSLSQTEDVTSSSIRIPLLYGIWDFSLGIISITWPFLTLLWTFPFLAPLLLRCVPSDKDWFSSFEWFTVWSENSSQYVSLFSLL